MAEKGQEIREKRDGMVIAMVEKRVYSLSIFYHAIGNTLSPRHPPLEVQENKGFKV